MPRYMLRRPVKTDLRHEWGNSRDFKKGRDRGVRQRKIKGGEIKGEFRENSRETKKKSREEKTVRMFSVFVEKAVN